jgi:hypothetical protein
MCVVLGTLVLLILVGLSQAVSDQSAAPTVENRTDTTLARVTATTSGIHHSFSIAEQATLKEMCSEQGSRSETFQELLDEGDRLTSCRDMVKAAVGGLDRDCSFEWVENEIKTRRYEPSWFLRVERECGPLPWWVAQGN